MPKEDNPFSCLACIKQGERLEKANEKVVSLEKMLANTDHHRRVLCIKRWASYAIPTLVIAAVLGAFIGFGYGACGAAYLGAGIAGTIVMVCLLGALAAALEETH